LDKISCSRRLRVLERLLELSIKVVNYATFNLALIKNASFG
jgi:hypothetical protein